MTQKENKILYRIRSLDPRLARARFSGVTVYDTSRSVRVSMICDETVPDDLRASALAVLSEMLPPAFPKIALEIRKIKSDKELIRREIIAYLKDNKMSLSHTFSPDDIDVKGPENAQNEGESEVISFSISVDSDAASEFESEVIPAIENIFREDFATTSAAA